MTDTADGTKRRVIVGVDGSQGARTALDWAVDKTEALGPVTPVLTYHVDALGDGVGTPNFYGEVMKILHEEAELRLAESTEDHPGLSERAELVRGHAGPALVRAAADADLLVVGSRGRSALAETLLGSVGSYCVKHAKVPVAVIPDETSPTTPLDHIVVGVDGSENAATALRWAMDHVAATGRIETIGCWNTPDYADGIPLSLNAIEANVTAEVAETVDRLRQTVDEVPKIETRIEYGDARRVLREAAREADLLVVGARGSRGVSYLLLGSVTTSLLHHPTAPTVVVPA